jgi:branched-chain amino acid transport system ATP-binding protein
MSSTDSILQVRGISLSFKGVKAINELSFDVRRSTFAVARTAPC